MVVILGLLSVNMLFWIKTDVLLESCIMYYQKEQWTLAHFTLFRLQFCTSEKNDFPTFFGES